MRIRVVYMLVLAAAIPLVAWNGLIQQINAQAVDLLMRLRPDARSEAARHIVLVAIDDETARRYGPLPLRRSVLAAGLEALCSLQPRVLALDMLISEPGDPADDRALAEAVHAFPRAIVSAAIENGPAANPKWILPLPALREGARLAHVHAEPDPDGVVRSVLLAKVAGGRRLWALGLETAVSWTGSDRPLETADAVRIGDISIPARRDQGRLMWINYAGPEGFFHRVSFAALLDGSATPAVFRDKICIVGATAQGGGDRLFTPLSSGIGMSGIEIHANVARTILDRAFLVPLSTPFEVLAYALLAAACVLGVVRLRRLVLLPALIGLGAALPILSYFALRHGEIWPLGSLLAVFVLSVGISGAGEYAVVSLALRGSERKRAEYAFRVQAIAHEVKSPLTAIQGSSEMISDETIPDQARLEMAGLIHKESKRLNTIIRTFLDVERLAAGTLPIRKHPVDLPNLCEEVLERARLYAARKRIEIRADVPPLRVQADPDLLSFAIYNLLTNAVKYSPKRTTIRMRVSEKAGAVLIAVTDQGYGIDPGEQRKIFDRFYRLKRDETGSEEGSGIGLALVKEIAIQHGGDVEVVSRPGAGSRFTLVIPKD